MGSALWLAMKFFFEPTITIYEKNISFHACAGNGITHERQQCV